MEGIMRCSRDLAVAASLAAWLGAVAIAQSGSPADVRQMRANGVDLSYVEQGRGAPVVFVHGAIGDLRYWAPQRDAFAKQHRFVAYTYRYHGTGPWPDDGKAYSAQTHAADLAALIAALKAGPAHIVGLSYGGLLAAMVALEEPQLVRTLTLAEPALFSVLLESPEGKAVFEEWNKGFEPMAAAIRAGDNARAARELNGLVRGGTAEEFDQLPAPFRAVLLENARTLPLLMAAPPTTISCEMLRGIKVPTLVVRGERTPPVFAKVHGEVGRCIGGSTSVVIPKASHPMSYDNPSAFNRAVLAFLARAPLPRPAADR
jgi:pimeloyl-ACP methyl ester carboxylesterase